MKVLFADKKNIVIGAMGFVILLLGFVLIDDKKDLPNTSPNVSNRQEKTKQEVAGIQTNPTEIPFAASDKQQASLIRVVDGDTISVLINGKNETVRVIGIDTPEVVDTRKSVECFGKEASEMANAVFENNKTVILESDPTQGDRDRYQRLLRYIWIENGSVDFGKLMLEEGFASEYTYNLPYKYQNEYKKAELAAQIVKKGLWSDDACLPTDQTPTVADQQPILTSFPIDTSGDKDCKDFATHAEAQAYFEGKGGSQTNNVDKLDADRDGIACESLP